MRVKVGNRKAARYMICDGYCKDCAFYSKSLMFCIFMDCRADGLFDQTGILEDIFKL